jgi:hypothetical protein
MKKLLFIGALFLLVPFTAYASEHETTFYDYRVPVTVTNEGASSVTSSVCVPLNISGLIAGGFMEANAEDYRAAYASTFPFASFLDSTSSNDACAWLGVKDLNGGFQRNFNLYMGNASASVDQRAPMAPNDLITVTNAADLHPATLYIKASSVTADANTHIAHLEDSWTLGINDSGNAYASLGIDTATTAIDQSLRNLAKEWGPNPYDVTGQSFQATLTGYITEVQIYNKLNSGAGSTHTMYITGLTGGAPDSTNILTSQTFTPNAGGSFAWTTITLNTPVAITSGSGYGLAIGAAGGSSLHDWGYSSGNPYPNGQWYYEQAGNWSGGMGNTNADRDYTFKITESTSLSGGPTLTGGLVNDGNAHDLIIDYDGASFEFYIDGGLAASTTTSGAAQASANDLYISSSSADMIRSIGAFSIATSPVAAKTLDLAFQSGSVAKTQTGASGNGWEWLYSVTDAGSGAHTTELKLISDTDTLTSTLSPLVSNRALPFASATGYVDSVGTLPSLMPGTLTPEPWPGYTSVNAAVTASGGVSASVWYLLILALSLAMGALIIRASNGYEMLGTIALGLGVFIGWPLGLYEPWIAFVSILALLGISGTWAVVRRG